MVIIAPVLTSVAAFLDPATFAPPFVVVAVTTLPVPFFVPIAELAMGERDSMA